jgi:hypothetical protein
MVESARFNYLLLHCYSFSTSGQLGFLFFFEVSLRLLLTSLEDRLSGKDKLGEYHQYFVTEVRFSGNDFKV